MSIINKSIYTTPVTKIRSFFFSVLLISQIIFVLPITVMAKELPVDKSSPAEKTHSAIFSQNIYHQHTGSSSGGGCYNIHRTGSRTEEYPCKGTMVYYPSYDMTQCDQCGASYNGDESGVAVGIARLRR